MWASDVQIEQKPVFAVKHSAFMMTIITGIMENT